MLQYLAEMLNKFDYIFDNFRWLIAPGNYPDHRLLPYFARRIRDRNEGCMESVCMFVDGTDSKVFQVGGIPQYSDPMFSGHHMSDELHCLIVNSPDDRAFGLSLGLIKKLLSVMLI